MTFLYFFFSSRRRHTRLTCDWSSDVCSSDLLARQRPAAVVQAVAPDLERADRLAERLGERAPDRSEERRVGKECRARWSGYHEKKEEQRQALRYEKVKNSP